MSTPAIELAQRLRSLSSHPGFRDLIRLSEKTVKVAEDAFVNFEGWDKEELSARSIAFRSAKKFHVSLFQEINWAIEGGIEEARQEQVAGRDPFGREAADAADNLRNTVLETYDTRVPGTY